MALKLSASNIICYVTDRASLLPAPMLGHPIEPRREIVAVSPLAPLLTNISAAAAAGVDWIQLREKDLAARDCAKLTRAALQLRSASSTKILINDRLDVAIAEQAAGVHLGENSLPIAEVRRLLNSSAEHTSFQFLIGVSCHSVASARAAASSGAGPPQGLLRLAEVCRAVTIPVLAIGGITLQNAAACADSGAAGIAAIRLFQESSDLSAVVAQLRSLR
jgi:thiamine-phosphate pyrophosphorylase